MSFYWLSPGRWAGQSWLGLWMERVYVKRRHPKLVPPGGALNGVVTVRGHQAWITSRWTPIIRVGRDRR